MLHEIIGHPMPPIDYSNFGDSKNPDITNIVLNYVAKHSCQLLQEGGPVGHKPRGSGVLIESSGKHYLLTASHVACDDEHNPVQLYVGTKQGLKPVAGDLEFSDLSVDKRLDLAYYLLHPQLVALLQEAHTFLPSRGVHVNHNIEKENIYMVYGFPAANIKYDKKSDKKVITVRTGAAFYSMRPGKGKMYKYYGFDEGAACIFYFAGSGQSYFTNEIVKVNPEPYGMSGCGLWMLRHTGEDSVPVVYGLLGIMTEFRNDKYQTLIGNWIDPILDRINEVSDSPPTE